VAYLEGKVYLEGERLEYSTVHFPQIKEKARCAPRMGAPRCC